ncbi:MAG: hypothetical protein PHP14_01440 [Candidatus Pacebacteria bacterium]|nr:hypothetical protein [Candidatus Paceibacterota bacterium]
MFLIDLGRCFPQETEKWIVALALAPLLKHGLVTEEERSQITNWFLLADPFKAVPTSCCFIKYYKFSKTLFCLTTQLFVYEDDYVTNGSRCLQLRSL